VTLRLATRDATVDTRDDLQYCVVMSFVKLDCGILDSTLWADRDAKDLFITALLMAVPYELVDPMEQIEVRSLTKTGFVVPPGWYGLVRAAGSGIVRRHGMEIEAGMTALERLGSPEPDSRTPDFDGRRIVRIDGGYIILNFQKYRDKDHTAADRSKRYRERKSKAQIRREKKVYDDHVARERRSVKAHENGDERLADEIAAEGL